MATRSRSSCRPDPRLPRRRGGFLCLSPAATRRVQAMAGAPRQILRRSHSLARRITGTHRTAATSAGSAQLESDSCHEPARCLNGTDSTAAISPELTIATAFATSRRLWLADGADTRPQPAISWCRGTPPGSLLEGARCADRLTRPVWLSRPLALQTDSRYYHDADIMSEC